MPTISKLSLVLTGLLVAVPPVALAETPKDPKSPLAGYVDGRGPSGPVELKILSPRPDDVIALPEIAAGGGKGGAQTASAVDVPVEFELKNYELFKDPKTETGQHIHFILDNSPYVAHYDASKPFVLKNVPRGTHTIRAFPSRPWHESIKEPGAFATVTFHVGEKDGSNVIGQTAPLLTYSRPKGPYPKRDADKILFDFYVTNCGVGAGPDECEVRYRIDDQPEASMTKWEPAYWSKMAVGRHAYTLTLYRNGQPVPGAFNLAKGFFEIVDDAPPKPAGPTPKPKPGAGVARQ